MQDQPLLLRAAATALTAVLEDMQDAGPQSCPPGSCAALLYQAAAQSVLHSVNRTVDEKAGVAHQIVRAFSVAPLQLVAQDGTAVHKLDAAPAMILHGVAIQLARDWVNEVEAAGKQ